MAAINRAPSPKKWYDTPSIRACEDGSSHEGECQLITWSFTPDPNSWDEPTGFAAVIVMEADEFKQHFEKDLKGDEKRFYDEWPQGFRWTCCGTPGDQKFGCDHHGWGSKPCTCGFCRMGKPISAQIHDRNMKSAYGMGLDLPRGPDSRSKQRNTAMNEFARALLGMDRL